MPNIKDVGAGGLDIEPGVYTLQVAAPLEDATPGQFGDRMLWQFWLWNADGELINEDDNTWWQWTSTAMGAKATANKWASALLDRELQKGESGAAIAAELFNEETGTGASGRAIIGPNDKGYVGILTMLPLIGRPTAATAKTAAPKAPAAAAPAAKPAPPAAPGKAPARRAAAPAAAEVAEIEPDEEPFV